MAIEEPGIGLVISMPHWFRRVTGQLAISVAYRDRLRPLALGCCSIKAASSTYPTPSPRAYRRRLFYVQDLRACGRQDDKMEEVLVNVASTMSMFKEVGGGIVASSLRLKQLYAGK